MPHGALTRYKSVIYFHQTQFMKLPAIRALSGTDITEFPRIQEYTLMKTVLAFLFFIVTSVPALAMPDYIVKIGDSGPPIVDDRPSLNAALYKTATEESRPCLLLQYESENENSYLNSDHYKCIIMVNWNTENIPVLINPDSFARFNPFARFDPHKPVWFSGRGIMGSCELNGVDYISEHDSLLIPRPDNNGECSIAILMIGPA